METEPQLIVSFNRLEKPGIEPATPGLQKERFIHFSMVAPRKDWDSLDCCNDNFNVPLKALGSAAPASEEIMINLTRPVVKSAYQKIFFLFSNQNICCGYLKEPSNETVLLST